MKFVMTTALATTLLVATTRTFRTASSFVAPTTISSSRSSLQRRFTAFASTATPETSADVAQPDSSSPDSSLYAPENAQVLANLKSPFLQVMRDRGFFHQCTGIEELDKRMSSESISAYLGFDATADSLHVGSLLQIMILRHLQQAGHRPIVLVGGGTSKVGDPTGKDESRVMLESSDIERNIEGISRVFDKFLTIVPPGSDKGDSFSDAIMVNNDDWLSSLKYLDFLREYGTQFTINRMMNFESVKQRLDRDAPFSFLEFNYMILQAYDFLELYRRYGAMLQMGGSDQWGNMVSGAELGRKCEGAQLFALTAPLITTSDGKKMGKTAGGAVWLNEDKLSSFDYWQFWRNTDDADVIRFLKLFTELPLEEIAELEKLKGADINKAKIVLADEATTMIHGKDCLKTIHDTVQNMFKGSGEATEGLPRVFVSDSDIEGDGKKLLDLFVELKLASSKKEARRLISGGGARLGDAKIDDENATLTATDFGDAKEVTLRAGKKRAGVVELQ